MTSLDDAARCDEAWDDLYRAMFGSLDETAERIAAVAQQIRAPRLQSGAPALRLVSGADAPDEGSIDGNQDTERQAGV